MTESKSGASPEIATGYRPGAISRIAALHIDYYSTALGIGLPFEAKVAREASEFFSRYDASTDRAWLILLDGEIYGSMVIDGGEPGASENGAHLRWFIMSDVLRGGGFGKELMRKALSFRREKRGFIVSILPPSKACRRQALSMRNSGSG